MGSGPATHVATFFGSKAGLAAHLSKRHGLYVAVSCVGGSTCQACSKEYRSTHRLREHVRRSAICHRTYLGANLGAQNKHEHIGHRHDRALHPPPATVAEPAPS